MDSNPYGSGQQYHLKRENNHMTTTQPFSNHLNLTDIKPKEEPNQQPFHNSFHLSRIQSNHLPTSLTASTSLSATTRPATFEPMTLPSTNTSMRSNKPSFRQWVENYRAHFPNYRFFFHNVPNNLQLEMSKDIRALGGTVEPFFSREVTHLIDNSSPSGGISVTAIKEENAMDNKRIKMEYGASTPFHYSVEDRTNMVNMKNLPPEPRDHVVAQAKKFGMKIWSLDTVQSQNTSQFMPPPRTNIGLPPIIEPIQRQLPPFQLQRNTQSRARLLHSETHHLHFYYLLVEDRTGIHRPPVIAEYLPPGDCQEPPWPRLYQVPVGRCPFINVQPSTVSKRKNCPPPPVAVPPIELKPHNHLQPYTNASAILSQSSHHPTAYPHPTTPTFFKNNQSLLLGDKERATRVVESAITPPIHPPHPVDSPFVLSQPLTPQPVNNGSSRLALPTQRLLVDPIGRSRLSKASGSLRSNAPTESPLHHLPPTKKPGYCENCKVKFEDLEEHITTRSHKTFAKNTANFTSLDRLLSKLQRPLKSAAQLTPSTTNPSSSSPNHWYGKSARDYLDEAPQSPVLDQFDWSFK